TYTRNRIRHHILPFAEKEIAGGAVANMGRAADILVETEDFVRQETQKAYRDCVISGEKTVIKEAGVVTESSEAASQILSVEHMLSYHPLIQKQVILYCLERLTPAKKDITHIHVEDVLALFLRSGNREIHLPYGITARRSYTKVILEKSSLKCAGGSAVSKDEQAVSYEIELPGLGGEALLVSLPDGSIMEFEAFECEKTINIPQNQYTKWFDYDKIKKPLAIRTRQIGDYLAFNAAFSKKSIQDYMVEEKIPGNERDSIYLLAEEHHILWVTGHRISSFYKINENTKHILQVRLRGGQ
ncbi:MAG: TilS substrate C-terminal domain-containing protein, partial [Lachnospiraceae bacterium]